MRACSWLCRPDEGIHAILTYSSSPDLVIEPGTCVVRDDPTCCIPVGTLAREVAIETASEAPPSGDPKFPYAHLVTLQVLA